MERIQEPMVKLQSLDRSVMESPAAKGVQQSFDGLMALMKEYEAAIIQDWCNQVAATSDEKLQQALLQFDDEATAEMPLLAVNFDPALVRLLRETKYFLLLKISVPDAAAVLFQHADTFR
jgi:dynein heavy chain